MRSRSLTFAMMANIKSYKTISCIFALALIINEILYWKFLIVKVKVMIYNFSIGAIRWQILKSINVIFYIFDFRHDMTCAHKSNTHTHTHTHTETNKTIAIGISQICVTIITSLEYFTISKLIFIVC